MEEKNILVAVVVVVQMTEIIIQLATAARVL